MRCQRDKYQAGLLSNLTPESGEGNDGMSAGRETCSGERIRMKGVCVFLLILAAAACNAQELRNEIAISAVGNLNSVSYIYLRDGTPVTSSQKSSLGWGAEYRRWLTPHFAIGPIFEQNASDGKLLPATNPKPYTLKYYIWPQTHYEMGGVATEQFALGKRVNGVLREGAGGVVTNGYDNCGWSHDFAFITGFGADYYLRKRTAVRTGMTLLNTRTGCYGDHTCQQTWSNVQDLSVGLSYRW